MTPTAARVQAQAKVNLLLRVLAREASGYHQLETLFARIDLADPVEVAVDTATREVTCHGADVGPMERNLAFRAAEAFLAATGWRTGFAITIDKRIPMGGGLGGGSADAGAVLRALNALAPTPLAPDALATIALQLGADVPFLTTEEPFALAWGRGERLLALPALPPRALLLCLPPFGVETAAAFGWVAQTRATAATEAPAPLTLAQLASWDGVARLAANDFEPAVTARHPEIGACLAALRAAGAEVARMSGSGSTVFGVFAGEVPPLASALPAGTRVLETRLADRVAPVERLG